MEKTADLSLIKKIIAPILQRHDVTSAAVFGSFARCEQKNGSDLDILVTFKAPKSFFELYDLEMELFEATDLKIDLVSEKALKKRLEGFIQRDLQAIL
jgi:predicted nucleotidyltransferase